MAGTKYLRRIYIGKESTDSTAWGTPVTTTAQLLLDGVIEREDTAMFPEYPTGNFGLSNVSYIPKKSSQIALSGEATFEQLPYIFAGGIYGATDTPTTDTGTGTGSIWTYQMPTTTVPAIQTYTVEAGDNEQGELFNYGFISDFTLSGASGEAWTIEATMMGRQSTDMTLAATSDRTFPTTAEPILFGNTKIYIDLASTDFGVTQKTLTLLGASVKVKTGWMPKFSADGRLDYSFIQLGLPEVLAELTFEHNATATAEKAFWLSQTERLIRLIATGTTLTSAGAYTTKTLIIDMVGKWENFGGLDDQDGNDIVVGTFRSRFSNTTVATSTQFTKFLVVNEVATLP
jgi:hypothetical protein